MMGEGLSIGECGEVVGQTLILVPLTEYWCRRLAPLVRDADRVDCVAHGGDPLAALLSGCRLGPAAVILDKVTREPLGAAGFTLDGNIWSLWVDLDGEQSRELMRHTPSAVYQMAKHAYACGIFPLSNIVWEGNRRTIAWLRASKCFDFGEDQRLMVNGLPFIPFYVRPLGDLQHV